MVAYLALLTLEENKILFTCMSYGNEVKIHNNSLTNKYFQLSDFGFLREMLWTSVRHVGFANPIIIKHANKYLYFILQTLFVLTIYDDRLKRSDKLLLYDYDF